MNKADFLCAEHAPPEGIVKTKSGLIWVIRDETKQKRPCACGKQSTWMRFEHTEDEHEAIV